MKGSNMETTTKTRGAIASFFFDVLRGFAIGTAFIIPGFSGGSIAAIMGVYEKLIGAIADIFKDFRKSFFTLLPIGVGMVLGVISLLFPLGWAIENFPLPTVSLFVGLTLGALPSITREIKGKHKPHHIASLLIPLLFAASLSFLPVAEDANLLALDFWGYALLFLIGIVGSAALVIPGISGSMLLLILGYYNPILKIMTEHLLLGKDIVTSILVLGSVGIGIAVGFFLISILMKRLLQSCKHGTYIAIIGFIVGSLPATYISTAKDAGLTLQTLPTSFIHWAACAALLLVGILLPLLILRLAEKKSAQPSVSDSPKCGGEENKKEENE